MQVLGKKNEGNSSLSQNIFENSPTTEATFTKALETVSPQAVFECKVSFNVEKGAPGLEDAQKTAMPVTEYKPE